MTIDPKAHGFESAVAACVAGTTTLVNRQIDDLGFVGGRAWIDGVIEGARSHDCYVQEILVESVPMTALIDRFETPASGWYREYRVVLNGFLNGPGFVEITLARLA